MSPDRSTDFLIIGAGFSGLVVAERLAAEGWKCVVVDRRNHLGGNAYDRTDAAGVLIHPYGPHYFRTNSSRIIHYLSRFTAWHHVSYELKSYTQGRYWSFPINLNTFEELIGHPATCDDFALWLDEKKVHITSPKNSEEVIISRAGWDFYKLFFESYTLKQWKRHPRDLDASVCGRVPIRMNRDNRYVEESFQAMPDKGYTALFENMIESSPNLEVHTGVDFKEAKARWSYQHLIFTGAIDEFYDRKFGALPYRSLRFEAESFTPPQLAAREPLSGKPGFWQPAVQVNYPDQDVPFTRIVEVKHVTGQQTENTTIVREYPKDWTPDVDPYYPVPAPDADAIYKQYAQLAGSETNTSFIGRLAVYRYYNMDQVTGMALAEADRLLARYGSKR